MFGCVLLCFFHLCDVDQMQVGYHNEHHDFPSIPWTRLPALKALAPEFYDSMPSHPSWIMVIINFIRDKEVGIFARAKRTAKPQGGLGEGARPGKELETVKDAGYTTELNK